MKIVGFKNDGGTLVVSNDGSMIKITITVAETPKPIDFYLNIEDSMELIYELRRLNHTAHG